MMQDNDLAPLGQCGDFCSECKFVLNSIYNISTTSSLNECISIANKDPKDRNSLLNELVKTPNENIINENDKELNNSHSELPLSTSHVKYKDCDRSEEEIQVLLHKKLKKVNSVHEELGDFNEIHMSHDYGKYSTRVKPAIIEDKILQSSEKLEIHKWKKQESVTSNFTFDSIYSKSDKVIKTVDKICEDITNGSRNLKNIHGVDRQTEQFTDISCTVIPTYSKSLNTLNKARATTASEYLSQYNTLKRAILNRRKKVFNVANNLLTLSTYLNGIRKTILETEDSNPSSICPDISANVKKIDKSTSPILFSKTCSTVTDLAPNQENDHDMYKYNPYSSRNTLKKKM